MNIKIILLSLLLVGCQKDEVIVEIQEATECSCNEKHEMKDAYAGANGQITVGWIYQYTTTNQAELCSKETGEWIYYNNDNSRYKVVCQ